MRLSDRNQSLTKKRGENVVCASCAKHPRFQSSASKPRQQFTPLYLQAVVDNDESEADKVQAQLEPGPTT